MDNVQGVGQIDCQSEYTESDRFLSPLTVPSYSALPAGSPVDIGSLVRISSIILWGGFCLLLIKAARLGFFLLSFFFALDHQRKSVAAGLPLWNWPWLAFSFASFLFFSKRKEVRIPLLI
ncbi:MAG: hypothetical protein Q8M08_00180 [Bacteroidales bacterium]|nr:hypothetical protein [Bacteroidales bacterium]